VIGDLSRSPRLVGDFCLFTNEQKPKKGDFFLFLYYHPLKMIVVF